MTGDRVNRDVERTARTLAVEAIELHDAIVAGALYRMAEHETEPGPALATGDLARLHRTEAARCTARAVVLVRRALQLAALYPPPSAGHGRDRVALARVDEA